MISSRTNFSSERTSGWTTIRFKWQKITGFNLEIRKSSLLLLFCSQTTAIYLGFIRLISNGDWITVIYQYKYFIFKNSIFESCILHSANEVFMRLQNYVTTLYSYNHTNIKYIAINIHISQHKT